MFNVLNFYNDKEIPKFYTIFLNQSNLKSNFPIKKKKLPQRFCRDILFDIYL